MIYRIGNHWALCPYRVKYMQHDAEHEQYTADKQWWLDFEQKWKHTSIIEFIDIEPTAEQLTRYEDIRRMPEDFGALYAVYVETGELGEEFSVLPVTHPFRVLIEQREQGIELSEREIQQIIQGQQMSDIEIRLIMGAVI